MTRQVAPDLPTWTFLSNHGHVLVCLAQEPDIRVRELADRVGITDRTAHLIINDLVEAGYVSRQKVGRRNRYRVNPRLRFRHPVERDHRIGEMLDLLAGEASGKK